MFYLFLFFYFVRVTLLERSISGCNKEPSSVTWALITPKFYSTCKSTIAYRKTSNTFFPMNHRQINKNGTQVSLNK